MSNEHGSVPSGPVTVADLVLAAAGASGSAVAVVTEDGATTYAELLARAAGVRDELVASGVRPGEIVAVMGDRDANTAAALLGVWAAGAAFVPVDPAYPAPRIAFELADTACRFVVSTTEVEGSAWQGDRLLLGVPRPGAAETLSFPAAAAAACVIYTSGSTGNPKGVVLDHRNLHNAVRHFAEVLALGPGDGTAWLAALAFDLSTFELLLALATGGRAVAASDQLQADPARLVDFLTRHDVSAVEYTPTGWRRLGTLVRGLPATTRLLSGGEPMPPAVARELVASGRTVFNAYGPAETTIYSTCGRLTDPEVITAGVPIANTTVHILDDDLRERAPGVVGEVCIAGHGVAIGYLNQPERTAERFLEHPAWGRLYRSGDLGRWMPDGRLEIVGRRDRQVKLGGRRVELNEVEVVVEEHGEVRSAAVVAAEGQDGPRLVAFVVAPDEPGLARRLWRHVADRLPSFSVPARFEVLPALPTTSNGKTDYRTLTAMASAQVPDVSRGGHDLLPRMQELFDAVVPGRDRLAPDENFFEAGLTSALLADVLPTLQLLCPRLRLIDLFRHPTVRALAASAAAPVPPLPWRTGAGR